ncbi:hypothetical protein CBR_g31885 [Chara braunii]|uniref:Uncharacterized protein n=1 Tax=Chara braunii TaxID=69332 RepID=A0A388LG57_CHABU|nr:hypothetical protein CBR_g31885 [Chara braunii]|eukprot:GBG81213.1 hypothetical protein CBR_g31885 [Chara braunii]
MARATTLVKGEVDKEDRTIKAATIDAESKFVKIWAADSQFHKDKDVRWVTIEVEVAMEDVEDELTEEEKEYLRRKDAEVANTKASLDSIKRKTFTDMRRNAFLPLASPRWVETMSTAFSAKIWGLETYNFLAPIDQRGYRLLASLSQDEIKAAYDKALEMNTIPPDVKFSFNSDGIFLPPMYSMDANTCGLRRPSVMVKGNKPPQNPFALAELKRIWNVGRPYIKCRCTDIKNLIDTMVENGFLRNRCIGTACKVLDHPHLFQDFRCRSRDTKTFLKVSKFTHRDLNEASQNAVSVAVLLMRMLLAMGYYLSTPVALVAVGLVARGTVVVILGMALLFFFGGGGGASDKRSHYQEAVKIATEKRLATLEEVIVALQKQCVAAEANAEVWRHEALRPGNKRGPIAIGSTPCTDARVRRRVTPVASPRVTGKFDQHLKTVVDRNRQEVELLKEMRLRERREVNARKESEKEVERLKDEMAKLQTSQKKGGTNLRKRMDAVVGASAFKGKL